MMPSRHRNSGNGGLAVEEDVRLTYLLKTRGGSFHALEFWNTSGASSQALSGAVVEAMEHDRESTGKKGSDSDRGGRVGSEVLEEAGRR